MRAVPIERGSFVSDSLRRMETADRQGAPRSGVAGRNWRAIAFKAILVIGFWTGVGLLFSTQTYLLAPGGTWTGAMQSAMPRWYVWGLLAPLIAIADRRWLRNRTLPSRLLLHFALGLSFTSIAIALRYGLEAFLFGQNPGPAVAFFVRSVYWDILIYGLIAGVHIAWDLAAAAQERSLREAQLEAHLAEARFRALQAQLHPHFLFNALNTISAYTETEPRIARQMMARLGELLRRSLDHADQREVPLSEELAFLEHYVAIERLRFEDRLTVDIRVDEEAQCGLVPALLLQPLVENAIRHGINAQMRGGRILISGRRENQRLSLCIEDDGGGLPSGWRLEDHGGVGLRNTTHRLAELYGAEHEFRIGGAPGCGVRVSITLPYRRLQQSEGSGRRQERLASL
jgi:two-component system LytT family sensor kinase